MQSALETEFSASSLWGNLAHYPLNGEWAKLE